MAAERTDGQLPSVGFIPRASQPTRLPSSLSRDPSVGEAVACRLRGHRPALPGQRQTLGKLVLGRLWGKYFSVGPHCPIPHVTIATMELKVFPPHKDEGQVAAVSGQAQLIKYLDGKVQLNGGSKEDHLAAHEWISLFWHEAVT